MFKVNVKDAPPLYDYLSALDGHPALRKLDLSTFGSGVLTDAGFARLASLPSLTDLNLSVADFQIRGDGSARSASFRSLKNFHISCLGEGHQGIPQALSMMPSLRSLNLRLPLVDLSDSLLAAVGKATSLTDLKMSGKSDIGPEGVAALSRLTSLKRLDLEGVGLRAQPAIARLADLPNLTDLCLTPLYPGGPLTGAVFAAAAKITTLERLELSGLSELADDDLAYAAKLPSLAHLDLHFLESPHFTGAGMGHLADAPSLTSLRLTPCDAEGHLPVRDMLAHLGHAKTLRRLDLDLSQFHEKEAGIEAGIAHLRSLRSLEDLTITLNENPFVTDEVLRLLKDLKALERLNIHAFECPELSGAFTKHMGKIASLRSLNLELYGCEKVTNDIAADLENLPQLRRLILNVDNTAVTDALPARLARLPAKLPTLERLAVSFYRTGISNKAMTALLAASTEKCLIEKIK